jgi:hypothetical protein
VAAAVVGMTGVAGVYVPGAKRYLRFIGDGVVRVNSVFTSENLIIVVLGNVPGVGILAIY